MGHPLTPLASCAVPWAACHQPRECPLRRRRVRIRCHASGTVRPLIDFFCLFLFQFDRVSSPAPRARVDTRPGDDDAMSRSGAPTPAHRRLLVEGPCLSRCPTWWGRCAAGVLLGAGPHSCLGSTPLLVFCLMRPHDHMLCVPPGGDGCSQGHRTAEYWPGALQAGFTERWLCVCVFGPACQRPRHLTRENKP